MNFEQRARKARDRGQLVRAAVLLIEGLKRNPQARSALDLLIDIYVDDLDSAGLGYDLTSALALQPNARSVFETLLEGLHEQQKESMGRELVSAASEANIELDWPPPAKPKAPKPPSELEGAPIDGADADDLPLTDDEPDPEPVPEPVPESEPEPEAEPETEPADDSDDQTTPSTAKPTATEAPDAGATTGSKRKKRWIFTPIVLVLIGIAAFVWWSQGARGTSAEQIDSKIEHIDPTDTDAVESLFGKRARLRKLSSPLAERRAFLHAVRAAEHGDASATVESQESAWGMAAAATSYALQSKFEDALNVTARLERQHPDALASHWALGFVAEARGRFASAVRHYSAGEERFPDFTPLITGQLRVHTRQGRAANTKSLQERLVELSPDNPYATMPLVIPELDDLAAVEPDRKDEATAKEPGGESASTDAQPRFVRAVFQLRRALDAIHRGERGLALEHADKALELEPQLGPALLVAGVLRVAAMDLDNGLNAFGRLAQLPGLDMGYRWTLQIAAPRALIAVGRADLAFQFVPPVKSAGSVAPRETTGAGRELPEPVVPMLSVETRVTSEPLAQQALLARADVLSLLGYSSAASESLGLLDGVREVAGEVGVRRALTAIRHGSRRSASGAVRSLGDHPRGLTASAALAYYTGRYGDAIEHARQARTERDAAPDDIITLRYLTLSLAADGRGREAMVVLDNAHVAVYDQPQIDALRMRVLARLAPRDKTSTATYETFEQMSVTSIDRLMDLADVAFWHKNFEQARAWTERVLAIAPELPEANWIRGLLAQVDDKEREAERYFRDAWRDGTDDPRLLIELGRIYLGLGDAKRAQAVYYRALLKERTSVEAIRGLGEAYLAYNRRVGHRDLSRILRSYTGSTSYVAQATATLKWLAILNGSRQGEAQGLKFLDQASTMVGESAELLIERARFHQARDEVSEARKLYARALEKNATLADARAGLARMALEEGDDSVARTQLERYLKLAPEGEHATWAREQLVELSGAKASSPEPDEQEPGRQEPIQH